MVFIKFMYRHTCLQISKLSYIRCCILDDFCIRIRLSEQLSNFGQIWPTVSE